MRQPLAFSRAARWLPLLLLCALSACGGGPSRPVASSAGTGNYAAPGPPDDPWGPYIHQAATRFSVPEAWPRAVMRQESGGHEYMRGQPITSDAGAMGLMQVMPATYAELAARYGLGSDPYDPHDNIMAGTGYIRELYDRYGSPAFLAAYNAGPRRLDTYLAGTGQLPNETVNYLASAAPNLGHEVAMTGPLAAFGEGGGAAVSVLHDFVRTPAGCWQDPDAAYDPDAPCRTSPPAQVARLVARAPVQVARAAPPAAPCWHDPDAAYDPDAPCGVRPVQSAPPAIEVASAQPPASREGWGRGPVAAAAPAPYHFPGNLLISSAAAATVRPVMATGRWAIQVGAFSSAAQARRAAESVRALAPRELAATRAVLGTTAPFGGQVLYRARLLGLSAQTAAEACGSLQAHSQACVTVPPGG